MCKGSQELHVGVRILIDTYHSVGWIWVQTKIKRLFSCEGRKKRRRQLGDMNMTGTSDTRQAFTFSPPPLLSFTGDHFWITRNPLPFFPAGISLTLWKVLHRYMLPWLRSKRAYADQCSGISGKPSDKRSLQLILSGAATAHLTHRSIGSSKNLTTTEQL